MKLGGRRWSGQGGLVLLLLVLALAGAAGARTLDLGGKTVSVATGGLIVNNPQGSNITMDNGTLGALFPMRLERGWRSLPITAGDRTNG